MYNPSKSSYKRSAYAGCKRTRLSSEVSIHFGSDPSDISWSLRVFYTLSRTVYWSSLSFKSHLVPIQHFSSNADMLKKFCRWTSHFVDGPSRIYIKVSRTFGCLLRQMCLSQLFCSQSQCICIIVNFPEIMSTNTACVFQFFTLKHLAFFLYPTNVFI